MELLRQCFLFHIRCSNSIQYQIVQFSVCCFVESTDSLTSPSTCVSQITMSTAKRHKSKVWDHFEPPKADNLNVTICNECNKQLAYKSTSTSAMARHLKSQHNIHINESDIIAHSSTSNQTNEQFSPKQRIDSASEAIARCAVDEMSVETILNSEILKDYLNKVHHSEIPKSEEEFNEIIIEYYNQVVEKYRLLFEQFKSKNAKFSITLDPIFNIYYLWFKKRYMSLTVHCKINSKSESFVLACSTDKLRVEEVLRKFGLDLNVEIIDRTQEDVTDLRKLKFENSRIRNELLFLEYYFLHKEELPNNEPTRKHMAAAKLSSQVWHHFAIKPDNPKVTICQFTTNKVKCNREMSYSGSSTSAMARHLKLKHTIDITKNEMKSKIQANLQFPQKESNNSLGKILSKCGVEGMSISTVTNSKVIRDYIDKVHHHEMPNSEEEIKQLIVQFYNQAVDEYRNMFEHFKSKGIRFSVKIKAKDYSYLGDLSVHCNVDSKIESFYLTNYYDELSETLRIFGLDLNSDIIAGTCDDDHVELSEGIIEQFCMKEVIERALWIFKYYDILNWQSHLYGLFQCSTHNLNVLQKYVDVGDGEKIEFVFYGFDWISTVQKDEQLLRLQPYIKEAFKSGELDFDEYDKKYVDYDEHKFGALKCLVRILKPLLEAQEELDKPNSNLLTAEVVMKYLFMKLRQIDSDMSRELIDRLNKKFRGFRNQNIVSLMYFLKHRKYPIEGFESFEYSSNHEIIITANKLNQRLFPNKNLNQQIPPTNSPKSSNSPTLIEFLNSEMSDTTQDVHLDGDLTSHFDSAERNKTLTPQLDRLYNALISIRPSLVKVQTKLFGWDNDEIDEELYNKLIFLKHYFIRKDAKQINQQKRPIEQ